MSIIVKEKFRGRTRSTGKNASAEIPYIIRATAGENDDAIEAALLAEAPTLYKNLVREGISYLEEIDGKQQWWDGSVRYVQPELATVDPGGSRTSFRTTGGTQHVNYSLSTHVRYGRPGKNIISFNNAVGVQVSNGVASVEGVDKFVPVFEWQETHVFSNAQVDPTYINNLYHLTGTVANDPWRVFLVGEVLFLGAEGSQREDGNWEITFHFAAARNISIPSIGDIKAGNGGPIIKRGWDYLWVHFREEEVTLAGSAEKILIPVPWQVNIEVIYEGGDFAYLGLGT